jgi:hypothetical protein
MRKLSYNLYAFLTLAADGGEWSALRPVRFTLGEELPVPTEECGWSPGPVRKRWRTESVHAGNLTPIIWSSGR